MNIVYSELTGHYYLTEGRKRVDITEEILAHDQKVREKAIEFISDKLIYPLLDEYDRALWEHISHIELAEEWIKVLDNNPYPKVKNHTEARKRDLRRWIAEQLKEQNNE